MHCFIVKQITCAADRFLDAVMMASANLRLQPQIGGVLCGDDYAFTIRQVDENLDTKVVFVILEADHQSFKGANFANLVTRHCKLGFMQVSKDFGKNYRKKSQDQLLAHLGLKSKK